MQEGAAGCRRWIRCRSNEKTERHIDGVTQGLIDDSFQIPRSECPVALDLDYPSPGWRVVSEGRRIGARRYSRDFDPLNIATLVRPGAPNRLERLPAVSRSKQTSDEILEGTGI
jgi:hypothetical protein